MTTSLGAARDQQAREYQGLHSAFDSSLGNHMETRLPSFQSGWAACLAELERRIGKFDKSLAIEQAKHEDSDGYFGFLTGAEWQWEQTMKVLRDQPEEEKP